MLDTIPENGWDDKVCHHLELGLLQEFLPVSHMETFLETYQLWEQREQKLNMVAIVYWLIGLHLFPHLSQRAVYARMVSGLRTVRDDVACSIPVKSAFSYRRKQVGSELLEELFHDLAGPQATEATPGAFWKGMRLMAVDGTVESVPDTPENRCSFRYSSDHETSRSPFPQARLVLVVECGTHLICDAEISECRYAEQSSMRELLGRWRWSSCLVLWDSGFHASWAIFALRARGCQVLGRLKSGVLCERVATLWDGSYLSWIYEDQGHHRGKRLLVRVISYTFSDPRIPGAGTQTCRLVTTLLDPFLYPAKDLAVLYHERWHVELIIDEMRTHLRLSARTLRSLTPNGVIQELYALLLAHVLLRRLMLRAATQAEVAPSRISFTETIHLVEETLTPLQLVSAPRRAQMVVHLHQELSTFQVPRQPLRFMARVVKRVRSRYERKKPEHGQVPPVVADLDIHQMIIIVT